MTYDMKFSHVLAALLVMPSYKPVNEKLFECHVTVCYGVCNERILEDQQSVIKTLQFLNYTVHLSLYTVAPHWFVRGLTMQVYCGNGKQLYMCSCAVVVLFPDCNNMAWE